MSDQNSKTGPAVSSAMASPEVDQDTEVFHLSIPVGLGAVVASGASLATCYAGILAGYIVGVQSVIINPHLQAILMWGFALVAAIFLWRDRKRHENSLPIIVGGLAVATLIVTLYFGYDERVEALAYILLVIGALLNQIFLLNRLNRTVRKQASEIDELNQNLKHRVERQEDEIGRLAKLKQFLAPQVAELVIAEDHESLLKSHRRYIACLFCDIRNFTTLSDAVEPEDVITVLQGFHDRIGGLVSHHGGTIGYRAGDGVMIFFNDPIPCDEPVLEAVALALEIRDAFEEVRKPWLKMGHDIGLGIGVAGGYATLGLVGIQGRSDYTAIGGVVNTASRLCDLAEDREILINNRAFLDVEGQVTAERRGEVRLKGISNTVEVHRVLWLDETA